MITDLFLTVLQESIILSFVVLALFMLSPFLNKRYAAKWRYWIWIFLALCFIIPINGGNQHSTADLSAADLQSQTKMHILSQQENAQKNAVKNRFLPRQQIVVEIPAQIIQPVLSQSQKRSTAFSWLDMIAAIWFAGCLGMILFHLVSFWHYRRQIVKKGICVEDSMILRLTAQLSEELHIKQTVPVIKSMEAASPMVIGCFHPLLVLPNEQYSTEELFFILKHEFVHLKRHDVFFKFLLTIANAMHWFNPLVWLMRREAVVDMELSCDESVVQGTDFNVRKAYTETLYATLHRNFTRTTVFSTQFYGGKQVMKKRFQNILAKAAKKNGIALLACAVIVTISLGTLVGCSVKAANQSQEQSNLGQNTAKQEQNNLEQNTTEQERNKIGQNTAEQERNKIGQNTADNKNIQDMGTEEIALGLGEEAFNKGIVMETIDVPDIVLENAKKQAYYEYYTTVKTDDTKCNFSNWRITSLEQCYTYDNLEGMVLPVYQMDFSFLADSPENVALAGGASITEDGWVTPDYSNSRFLIFKQEGETLTYLTCLFENDCAPGDELFTEDLKLQLIELGIIEQTNQEVFNEISGKWIIDFERTDASLWGTGVSYGNEMEFSKTGLFQYYIGIGIGGIGQCEIKEGKIAVEVEPFENPSSEKERLTLQYVSGAEQEYILMDWYNNEVYWIRNNKKTAVLVSYHEGEAEYVEAVLTQGDGYSIYLTTRDWQQEEENTWTALINKQVRFWITHFEGKTAGQVKQELTDNDYALIDGTYIKQEGDLLYKVELKEYPNDIWGVCSSYPIEAEEGWGRTIVSMSETFAVTGEMVK